MKMKRAREERDFANVDDLLMSGSDSDQENMDEIGSLPLTFPYHRPLCGSSPDPDLSVSDPDPATCGLKWLPWIRIFFLEIPILDPDSDSQNDVRKGKKQIFQVEKSKNYFAEGLVVFTCE